MNRHVFRLLVACLFCGGIVLFAPPLLAQKKLPIPPDEARQQVLALFREVYGEAWKQAKTGAQRRELAEELLKKARESRSDAPTHFVLLRLARDMAAMAGEADMAFRAIDETAARFQVDAFAMKAETLERAAQAASTAGQSKTVAERARTIIDEAVEHDAFDVAQRVHEAAVAAARNAQQWTLARDLVGHYREIEPLVAAHAEIQPALRTLEEDDPVDPEANLVVGRYYCFDRGAWDRGLSYLALGTDTNLQAVAIKELEEPKTSNDHVALGDAWWDLASTMEEEPSQLVQTRAAHWYKLGLPRLAGLERAKVERRLAQLEEMTAEQKPPPRADPKPRPAPKRPRKRQPETYTFVDEPAVKEHWDINGRWRIEGEGIRLFERGASIRFRGSIKGNAAIRIVYQVPINREMHVRLFGETLQFGSGSHIATIVRKDDTILYARGNMPPMSVRVRQERLDMASDLEIILESRWIGNQHLLIHSVTISSEE